MASSNFAPEEVLHYCQSVTKSLMRSMKCGRQIGMLEADDIAIESAWSYFEATQEKKKIENPKAYIRVIIGNRIKQALRDESRRKASPLEEFQVPLFHNDLDLTTAEEGSLSQLLLPRLESQLTTAETTIYEYWLQKSLSSTEIADKMGKSIGSVEKAISRIREKAGLIYAQQSMIYYDEFMLDPSEESLIRFCKWGRTEI